MIYMRFGGNETAYVRTSSAYQMLGGEALVECDTDAGGFTLTLPTVPTVNSRHEVWIGPQPGVGATVTIATSEAVHGASLTISAALEGRVLTWIKATPGGGGYWLCRAI
jgi:hypothetical protein